MLCNTALFLDYVRVENFQAQGEFDCRFNSSMKRKSEKFLPIGSGLTTRQRTLIIVSMSLILYIGFGAMTLSWLESGKLKFSNALYFCVCTVTTLGFGDITPTQIVSRIFIFFYTIGGVILLALTVSTTRDTIFEVFESFYRSRRRVMVQRFRDKRLYKEFPPISMPMLERSLCHVTENEFSDGNTRSETRSSLGARWLSFWSSPFRKTLKKDWRSNVHHEGNILHHDAMEPYKSFEKNIFREEVKDLRTRVIVAGTFFACFWVLGGVVFKFTEGWTFGESFYFTYVAFLTLGYGDYTVSSLGGRAFFTAWALLGIGNMTLLLAVLTQVWELKYKRAIGKRGIVCSTTSQFELATKNKETLGSWEYQQSSDVDIDRTADMLVEAAKEFSKHSHFWMEGKSGEPPAGLLKLLKDTKDVEGLERISGKHGLIEAITSSERRQKLFLISFAKSFEALTERTSEVKRIMKSQQDEIITLKHLVQSWEDENKLLIKRPQSHSECSSAAQASAQASAFGKR
ncbi:hypothetical protein O181_040883 [Austropuccinia psidii MF-1]|uniref:Potassium channel domain-containing protein n=1 Tax=Austropuccinia psidii MF-1 TaxID=1389203 RepID=A0A9Q3DGB0_9BASI|nr:hypothetical protein [Austropuccinia psidii MF-1]